MSERADGWAHRTRVVEAALLLCLARLIVNLLPFRAVAPMLGAHGTPANPDAMTGSAAYIPEAVRAALAAAGARLPWSSTCLTRAFAGRLMLGRRGVSSLVRIGVSREAERQRAHAWLIAQGVVVSGGFDAENYTPIADFVAKGGRSSKGSGDGYGPRRAILSSRGPGPARAQLRLTWQKLVRLRQPKGTFQPYGTTSYNRYPRCFSFAQNTLGSGNALRLLSFGCSTGEEVFTLAEYFPRASIKGIDINPEAIAAARMRTPPAHAGRISFAVSGSAEAECAETYDAVFSFAVFRHGVLDAARPVHCNPLIRFADFEVVVAGLARCLKPGGLLFMRHAHFRFADTQIATGFDPVLTVELAPVLAGHPLYGPDNRLLPDTGPLREVAWCKRAQDAPAPPR